MMLYLIGLGLCDPSDITVKGLEVVKKASRVYLEAYTSILIASSKEELVRPVGVGLVCETSGYGTDCVRPMGMRLSV